MTYCSRKSWISLGFGSSSNLTSELCDSSSSMISLQRSMHSSQMYTPGPAMSFLTCFWLLPQNEHFSRSPPSPNLATSPPLLLLDQTDAVNGVCGVGSADACRHADSRELTVGDHFVDDAVLLGLRRTEDEVAVGVLGHLRDLLARVVGKDLVERFTHAHDLLGLD